MKYDFLIKLYIRSYEFMRGPAAPGSLRKGTCLYVILDKTISGKCGDDGKCRRLRFFRRKIIDRLVHFRRY